MNTTNNKKTIGMLGGMGPLASANLYYKIVEVAQNEYHAEQDTDFPPMFIYSLPLVGFDESGFVDSAPIKGQLIEGVKKLEKGGSDFIIIACNTVHYFYTEMQEAIDIPIISITEETARAVANKGYNKVGLLTSESTHELGFYQDVLHKYGVETLSVTEEQQKVLNQVILDVMSGKQGGEDKEDMKKIIDDLYEQGAQSIVLGCTELPLALTQHDVDMALFASTEIIAQAALEYAFKEE